MPGVVQEDRALFDDGLLFNDGEHVEEPTTEFRTQSVDETGIEPILYSLPDPKLHKPSGIKILALNLLRRKE